MKTNKLIFVTIFMLIVIQKISVASHAMGGNLTYQCLGSGPTPGSLNYRLTFTFYRDCIGSVTPANPLNIDITNTCGFTSPTLINIPLLSTRQIPIVCQFDSTTCNGGIYTGIEEWKFQGDVTLPGYCSEWTLAHSEGVRNSAITTVTSPSSYNLYVFCKINNSGGTCNNSPTFSVRPVPIACAGQQFCFNQAAFDQEGDSLTYQLITPRSGPLPSDTIDYAPGYSTLNPITSPGAPMIFNPFNGDFCLFPSQQEVTVLAILVNEYRDGDLIGQTERDLQINITQCTNTLPKLQGLNGTPVYSHDVCANQQNCFFIHSVDPDIGDNLNLTWSNTLPGATFSTSGGTRDTAYICWSPSPADTVGNPHFFTVSVYDDHCPYLGTQTFSYYFTVDASATCHSVLAENLEQPVSEIKIFPQPAIKVLNIDLGTNYNSGVRSAILIKNILGQTIYDSSVYDQLMSINIDNWSTGIKFIYLMDDSGKILCRKMFLTSK